MTTEDEFGEVRTTAEFVRFLITLARSRREEPEVWENDSVDRLLEAWAAWVEDMDGYFQARGEPVPQQPSWAFVAQMLLAARVYESKDFVLNVCR